MNSKHEDELANWVDQELQALPPLQAPRTLAPRVLAAIAASPAVPWYRSAWTHWPRQVQAAALLFLLGVFGAICFGGDLLAQHASGGDLAHRVGKFWSVLHSVEYAGGLLADAAKAVLQHIGMGYVYAAAIVVLMAYALCIALGSACFRFVTIRR